MSMRSYEDQLFEEQEGLLSGRFSAAEKLAEVTRELGLRRRVYARLVEAGRMRQAAADRQVGIFESIEADYRKEVRRGNLL